MGEIPGASFNVDKMHFRMKYVSIIILWEIAFGTKEKKEEWKKKEKILEDLFLCSLSFFVLRLEAVDSCDSLSQQDSR